MGDGGKGGGCMGPLIFFPLAYSAVDGYSRYYRRLLSLSTWKGEKRGRRRILTKVPRNGRLSFSAFFCCEMCSFFSVRMNVAFVKLEQFLAISFLSPVFPLPNRAEIVAKSIGNGRGEGAKWSRRQKSQGGKRIKFLVFFPPLKGCMRGLFISALSS